MKELILLLCLLGCVRQGSSQTRDTFALEFPMNNAKLTKEITDSLDQFRLSGRITNRDKLLVIAFADDLSGRTPNYLLSVSRTNSIFDYFIGQGFVRKNITLRVMQGGVTQKRIPGRRQYAPYRTVEMIAEHNTGVADVQQPTKADTVEELVPVRVVRDTFEVKFPSAVEKLGTAEQHFINDLFHNKKLLLGEKLIVLGYADYVGGKSYNDTLSFRRATNVREHLISLGFVADDIKLCVGKGKIDRANVTAKKGYAADRKVQIIIDREEMAKKRRPSGDMNDNLDFESLKVNETYKLNNIFFKLNSPELLDQSRPDLERLLSFMERFKTVAIQIEGHVCCMGPVEGTDSKYKRRNLSECRAEAIYNYLVGKGIGKERLSYAGLANYNPIVKNEVTEADKQKNRRVEIRILSK